MLLFFESHLSSVILFPFLKEEISDSCNLAAVAIVLTISPFLQLAFHVLSTYGF